MKIIQINKFYYLKGGAERYFFDLSEILMNHGHEVIHFSMADNKNSESRFKRYFIKNVEFNIFSSGKIFYNYEAVKKLEKIIKEEKPDIAHLHNIAHQLSPAVIMMLKKYNIPVVQTLHDYKLICPNYKLFSKGKVCRKCKGQKYYNCFFNKCFGGASLKSFIGMAEAYLHNMILKTYDDVDLFIAPTEFVKKECIEFGIPDKKIIALNYFLSEDNFMRRGEFKMTGISRSLRGGEAIDNRDYLLYYGRLSKEKGVEILIGAMEKISRKIKLKIVGSGPMGENFRKIISDKNLAERVEMAGAKYGDELKKEIAGAKAIVAPSIWPETLGYVLIEAMAMRKVVVASRIGGMQEFINDGVNGFFFRPGSIDDMANKINNLDKFNLLEIGNNARHSVSRLNGENHYEKIMKIYKSVISRNL